MYLCVVRMTLCCLMACNYHTKYCTGNTDLLAARRFYFFLLEKFQTHKKTYIPRSKNLPIIFVGPSPSVLRKYFDGDNNSFVPRGLRWIYPDYLNAHRMRLFLLI